MKYIIYNQGHLMNLVVLFERLTNHDDMARKLGPNVEIESAGFVDFQVNENGEVVPHCHGKSDSLKISSQPNDAIIIKSQLSRYY